MPNDPVTAALLAAQAQAAAAPAATSVATQNTAGGAVAIPTPKAGPGLSMETMMMGSMTVDAWIKPSEYGLRIGDKPELFSTVEVMLDFRDGVGFVPKKAIKGGNPAVYAYSLDGITAVGGGSWEAAQGRIRALAPTASEYRAVDLPFTLLADVYGIPPGPPPAGQQHTPVLLAKAGQRLGYTTSTTNWGLWEAFYREATAAGLKDKKVRIELGAQRKTNAKNNVWGIMTFKLLGEVEADDAE